jgi:hypothetical protein
MEIGAEGLREEMRWAKRKGQQIEGRMRNMRIFAG